MRKFYSSPEAELICFAADEKIAAMWDAVQGSLLNAGALEDPSAVDFEIPGNPEGNF